MTVVDATGNHVYQPGFMYIAMGGERAERARPARALAARPARRARRRRASRGSTPRRSGRQPRPTARRSGTTSSSSPPARGSCPRRSSTSATEAHHFYTAEAAARLRDALDAFTGGRIVIGIAGMPYKCPPAPLEVAFLIEAELRERGLRDKTEMHFCSPDRARLHDRERQRHGHADPRAEGHRAAHVLQRRADRPRAQGRRASRGEELPYDLLILVPPHGARSS